LYSEDGSGNQYAGSYVDKTDDVIVVCHTLHSNSINISSACCVSHYILTSYTCLLHDDVAWKIAKNNWT